MCPSSEPAHCRALGSCCGIAVLTHKSLAMQSDTALSGKAADAERAGVALDSFCRSCSSNVNQLVHSACYFKQGQMLVEAVQGALPRTHSVQVLAP